MKDLNFFSSYILQKRASRRKMIVVSAVLGVAAVFIAGTYVFTALMIHRLEGDIAAYRLILESEETKKQRQELEEIRKKIDILGKYETAVTDIQASMKREGVVGSTLIGDINRAMPQNVLVKSLTLSAGGIQISGASRGRVPAAEFQHNLVESGLFRSVHISILSSPGKDNADLSFEIKCLLKDVKTE